MRLRVDALRKEIPNASREGPKIMIACVGIGMFTGFIFLMVLLFVSGGQDTVDSVIASPAGPLLQIFVSRHVFCQLRASTPTYIPNTPSSKLSQYTATSSRVGAVCLLVFPLICLVFATIGIMTTSSRMTYAFARDRGLPASHIFAKVNKKLGLPLNALMLTTALVIIFGKFFFPSQTPHAQRQPTMKRNTRSLSNKHET